MRAHVTMQARSGDGAFLARVNGAAFAGVVHSAFRRAVNIACLADGELHTLVTGELDDGPNSLVVSADDFLAIGICQGDSVRAGGGSLAIAGKVMVNVAGAAVWRTPMPETRCAASLLRRRLAEAEASVWRSGTPGGFIEGMADTEIARLTRAAGMTGAPFLLRLRVNEADKRKRRREARSLATPLMTGDRPVRRSAGSIRRGGRRSCRA